MALSYAQERSGLIDAVQSACMVCIAAEIRIPACCEMLIEARLDALLEVAFLDEGVVEPKSNFYDKMSMFMARTLVKLKGDGIVPVLVANTSNEDKILPAKTKIGSFEPVVLCNEEAECNVSAGGRPDLPEIDPISLIDWKGSALTAEQQKRMIDVFRQFPKVFSKHDGDLGRTQLIEHKIILTGPPPPVMRACRMPEAVKPEANRQLGIMREQQIIVPSTSSTSASLVIVPKRDGPMHMFRLQEAE